ncbi:MAG: DUF6493 family protein [Enterobacteriaceae bacterium]|nr:DUF6493 family protein [Enterobacteriaceae bacterium]
MNNVEEKYCKIIESGNSEQMIAFLKRLDEKTRRALVPLIKKDVKRLYTYQQMGENQSWEILGNSEQLVILGIAMFSCYGRKDYKNIDGGLVLSGNRNIIDRTLNWYCPEWFSAFIDYNIQQSSRRGYAFVFYEKLAKWLDEGYIDRKIITDESVASTFSSLNISFEKYPFILDDHIWLIFTYPPYLSGSNSDKWMEPFKTYTKNQRLDRSRVLKESLLAINRNFDRGRATWFASLFSTLEPTIEECIQLQDQLFAAFSCPHSKPVNTALHAIKKIIDHPAFRADEFISYLPLLFSSVTKGIVSSSLTLVDKLAKQTPAKRPEICQHLTGVFLSKDASLQNNAAKLLVKYGDPTDPALSALLMSYTDNLLFDARERLTDFLDVKPAAADIEEEVTEVLPLIREDNRIPEIECWDDFVFLAGRAFLNLESYHFDQLPATLIRFAHAINEDNVAQLEPAFAQAWKTLQFWPATQGIFDRILATFFLEFMCQLVDRFANKKIATLYTQYQELKHHEDKYKKLTWGFNDWQKSTKAGFQPYIDILLTVLQRLKTGCRLPLLSTPTHLPCFIEPCILIERLKQYQQAGETPCSLDFQLALQRCTPGGDAHGLSNLHDEYENVMRYFLSGDLAALEAITVDDWALTAIITRNPLLTDAVSYDQGKALLEKKELPLALLTPVFPWRLLIKETIRNYSNDKIISRVLRFDVTQNWRQADTTLFYQHVFSKGYSHHGADQQRIIFSFPWYCDGLLMRFIETHFKTAEIKNEVIVTSMLRAIYELPLPLTSMGHLLIAFSLLHSSKTVRTLAAELWNDKLRHPGGINATHIGDILGKLEAEGWAPLKRFTDLAMQSMINISARHNAALLEMVNAMDAHLNSIKINNYKKLTELQLELTRRA